MSLAINWNTDESFWVLNPMVKSIKVFNNFFKADKSRGKKNSSQVMWAIALLLETKKDNPYRNLNIEEKRTIIASDFLEDPNFNWDQRTIKELLEVYENHILTIAEKELFRFEEKLYQRGEFIANTDYTFDAYGPDGKLVKGTVDQLDKMLLNTGKLFDQLEDIKTKIAAESAKGSLRGGSVESASEEGLI